MATEVRLPELGENVTQADVVRVLVSVGDTVSKDQSILEIENEKASVEVPSPVAGTVASVAVEAGQTVEVGALLLTIEAASGAAAPSRAPAPEDDETEEVEERERPEDDGEAGPEDSGGPVRAAQPSPSSPPPRATAPSAAPTAPSSPPKDTAPGPRSLVPAAPTVRRFAREIGVDLSTVKGSGPGGRVSIDDVKRHAHRALKSAGHTAPAAPPLPDLTQWSEVERQPMSSLRRLTAEAMTRAWSVVPHVTHHDHADITDLEASRRRLAARVEAVGGKLTVTAVLVKVVAAALRTFPQFNAALDTEGNAVVYRRSVHVGVAVDTDRGLVVPVVRDADRKSLTAVATELRDLADRARSRKLGPAEMQGAGFTISNLGGIGGDAFTPIVNWPEVAVLGVSRSAQQPVWTGEAFEPRLILPLSLSYDHRLIDGADAARFLRWLCEALEEPLLVALGG